MNLGRLSYTITGDTKPLQSSLKGAQGSIKSADSSMKKGAKNITDHSQSMGQSASSAIDPMSQGLQSVHPAAGQAVSGMKSASVAARGLQAAMGPIGIAIAAIGAAVAALTSYFTKSVEGQQKFAKIMAYVGGVADTVKDLFIDLGRWIVRAFTDPQQAVMDLWDVIKNNFINRFQGLVDMVVSGWKVISKGAEGVGLAIAGIFDKSKREEAKQAFAEMGEGMADFGKASNQAITGVDDLIGKMGELGKQANDRAKENMALQERENRLWEKQLEAKVDIAKIEGELAEARRIANDDSEKATDQMHAQERAAELVAEKYAIKRKNLEEELAIQEERMKLGIDEEDDIEKRNELQVQLINLKQREEDMTRTLLRRQATIQNQVEAELKARNEIFEEIKKSRMEEEEKAVYGLKKSLEERLDAYEYTDAERAEITEHYENQIAEVRKKAAEEELQAKEEMLAEIDQAEMTQVEKLRHTLNEKLEAHELTEEERAKVSEHYEGKITEAQRAAEQERLQEKQNVLERIRKAEMTKAEELQENMNKELEIEGLTNEERYKIRKYWQDKIDGVNEDSMDKMKQSMIDMEQIMEGALQGIASSFVDMAFGAEKSIKDVMKEMAKMIMMQVVSAIIGRAMGAMFGGGGGFDVNALTGGLKGAIPEGVPGMAEGGIAKGETLVNVGDYSGASVNPEVIAPLSDLSDMIKTAMSSVVSVVPDITVEQPYLDNDRAATVRSGTMSHEVAVTGQLAGQDIMISNERAGRRRRLVE